MGLLKRGTITHGYYVRSSVPKVQVVEVLTRFELAGATRPFSRCTLCNGDLVPVDKKDVADRVPAGSLKRFEEFRSCSGCGRIYWEGSHTERASDFIDEVLRESDPEFGGARWPRVSSCGGTRRVMVTCLRGRGSRRRSRSAHG